jgi:hypothetical protein
MADTITPKLGLTKPEIGASADTWGNKLNENFNILDLKVIQSTTQWSFTLGDDNPESTAGPFIITRYANSTLRIDDPLTINRQTGDVTIPNNLSVKNITSTEKQTANQLVSQKGAILGSGNATFIPTLNSNNLTYVASHIQQVSNDGFMANGFNTYHDGANWKNYVAGWSAQVNFNAVNGFINFGTTDASVAKDAVPTHPVRFQIHPTGTTTTGNHIVTGSSTLAAVQTSGEIKVGYNTSVGTIRFTNIADNTRYLHHDGTNFTFNGGTVHAPSLFANGSILAGLGRVTCHDLWTYNWGNKGGDGILFMGSSRSHYLFFNGDINRFSLTARLGIGEPAEGSDAATVNYVIGRTSFTPVQQGGGAFQAINKVYLGWDGIGLRAQVDATDLGRFVMEGAGVIGATWIHAGDISFNFSPVNVFNEPLGANAVCISFRRSTGGLDATRHRYLQLNIAGAFYTVGASS